ncbi:MAG: hypothetical protein HY422_02045 [Candidatus Komeilibacteria bacterium]|nr:hypothetical protein [Candidatus Komeilibacteria bacterium]
MEYLPIVSIIYGLLLLALSATFTQYSQFEFSSIIYAAFFLCFGVGLYILQIASDFGFPLQTHGSELWVFSVAFFGTSLHIFFKTALIRVEVE